MEPEQRYNSEAVMLNYRFHKEVSKKGGVQTALPVTMVMQRRWLMTGM